MRLQFLGTGTSTGVPMIGCACRVCSSPDPHDQRLRSGLLLEHEGFHLLVDTSTDIRAQVLRHKVPRVDAVLLTHAHVDHLYGLDELRRFNLVQRMSIPVHSTPETLDAIHRVFAYLFAPALPGTFLPNLVFQAFETLDPFEVGPFSVTPFEVYHGLARTVGYRIDCAGHSIGYACDCKTFPDAAYPLLQGLDVMVLDALRLRPHPSHLSFDESAAILRRIEARQSFFTHLSHDLLHAEIAARFAPIRPAFDGLTLTLDTPVP